MKYTGFLWSCTELPPPRTVRSWSDLRHPPPSHRPILSLVSPSLVFSPPLTHNRLPINLPAGNACYATRAVSLWATYRFIYLCRAGKKTTTRPLTSSRSFKRTQPGFFLKIHTMQYEHEVIRGCSLCIQKSSAGDARTVRWTACSFPGNEESQCITLMLMHPPSCCCTSVSRHNVSFTNIGLFGLAALLFTGYTKKHICQKSSIWLQTVPKTQLQAVCHNCVSWTLHPPF